MEGGGVGRRWRKWEDWEDEKEEELELVCKIKIKKSCFKKKFKNSNGIWTAPQKI